MDQVDNAVAGNPQKNKYHIVRLELDVDPTILVIFRIGVLSVLYNEVHSSQNTNSLVPMDDCLRPVGKSVLMLDDLIQLRLLGDSWIIV